MRGTSESSSDAIDAELADVGIVPRRPALDVGAVRLAVVAATAVGHLNLYRLSTLVAGRSPARARRILQRWSAATCRRFGIAVEIDGAPPPDVCAYVANHRSYLDIAVLSAALGATFVSRADVATWRVVGPAARAVDAVFVDRDDPRGRVRAARALARRLADASVVVFPEGTTSGGRIPGAFPSGPFRLLHRVAVPVVPVTLRYSDRRAYWTDDISLAMHLRRRVLAAPGLVASVHVGEPLGPQVDGRALARAAHAAVCRPIEELGELVGISSTGSRRGAGRA